MENLTQEPKLEIQERLPPPLKEPLGKVNKTCKGVIGNTQKGERLKEFKVCQKTINKECLALKAKQQEFNTCLEENAKKLTKKEKPEEQVEKQQTEEQKDSEKQL